MKKLYLKRTFRDGDWYILKHLKNKEYKVIYIYGKFILNIGDIIEIPQKSKGCWKHEKLTLEQVWLEVL